MTMFAQFDADGRAVGFWAPFQTDRPFGVVEITDQQWQDLRAAPDAWRWDGAEIVAHERDAAEVLAEWRAGAVLSKPAFLAAAQAAGLITRTDRLEAARGQWPAGLEGAVASLTDDERADVEIAWAEASSVSRTHPALSLVQAHLGLTDAQVDALFGGE